ncbi:outer membrane lipoprotein-sorting protein [Candidatus Puniceispirillum sp.]|nr:outer membrane lipoprotein-sorting protein [Candidatus Puniceispirillum sp.]
MKLATATMFVAISSACFTTGVFASSEKGLKIAIEADRRDKGFRDSTAQMTMVLMDKYGQSTERAIRNRTFEGDVEGDKSLVIFDSPGDVRGTAFLSHTKKADSDDQWLYLPALKRVKRIASSNKAGPFMGSEFSYEDIASQEVEKYTYNYLRDEELSGLDCFVVEYDPVDPKSGYKRQIVWVDKSEYRVHKIDFFDRKDALLKTLYYEDYNQYLNKFWRSNRLVMTNHQTGKKTELLFANWKLQTGMNKRDFEKSALKRTR